MPSPRNEQIDWRPWSTESFENAEKRDILVLLDLTATWCHWCHVMDNTTYSDPDVISLVNESFVPVRVDIDERPDVSERYNRGGFPTTAFLSSRGESIWGATYIPPKDMKRIIGSILKAKRTGEIARALENSRIETLKAQGGGAIRPLPSKEELDYVFHSVYSAYDPLHGGFGREPKFPNPDAVDMLIYRYLSGNDRESSHAVRHTLLKMTNGLYDKVEGGVFRYSVTRDWSVPHYEKMLETNLGLLTNLAMANVAMADPAYEELADGVAGYLLEHLLDREGRGFYGSQDADEEYYKLSYDGRSSREPPSIDRNLYSGWNALASAAFIKSGVLLGRRKWVEVGVSTLDAILRAHWDEDFHLIRHSERQRLFLFEDQMELLKALLIAEELSDESSRLPTALQLADGVREHLAHDGGGMGDVIPDERAIGELGRPRRSLITNSKWAQGLSLLGIATGTEGLIEEARSILGSFDLDTVEMHGPFASSYYMAAIGLRHGPYKVVVHSRSKGNPAEDGLWTASMRSLMQNVFTSIVNDSEEFAVICSSSGCSDKIMDPGELSMSLRARGTGQI